VCAGLHTDGHGVLSGNSKRGILLEFHWCGGRGTCHSSLWGLALVTTTTTGRPGFIHINHPLSNGYNLTFLQTSTPRTQINDGLNRLNFNSINVTPEGSDVHPN